MVASFCRTHLGSMPRVFSMRVRFGFILLGKKIELVPKPWQTLSCWKCLRNGWVGGSLVLENRLFTCLKDSYWDCQLTINGKPKNRRSFKEKILATDFYFLKDFFERFFLFSCKQLTWLSWWDCQQLFEGKQRKQSKKSFQKEEDHSFLMCVSL